MLRIQAAFTALLASSALALGAAPASAQIQGLPQVSQRATVTQIIGVAEISVVYHRPAVRGRQIWDGLVPYGQVWRAGANENTILRLSHPVSIGGTELRAGMYGLHVIPNADKWIVAINKDSTSWGSYSYVEKLDAVRVEVKPKETPHREWLTYEIDPVSMDQGRLTLSWEKLSASIDIHVDTPAQVVEKLRKDLEGPLKDKWQTWHGAAEYCLEYDLNLDEALAWSDHAASLDSNNFAVLAVRAGLLEKLGEQEAADEVFASAVKIANSAELTTYAYGQLQSQKFERAAGLAEIAIQRTPTSWWAWSTLAEAQEGLGLVEQAAANYAKAIELVRDENQKAFLQDKLNKLAK